MPSLEDMLKTVIKWVEEYARHEVINHVIAFFIPFSIIQALIQWVMNPTKSFLAIMLVTSPFTITITFMVIILMVSNKLRYNPIFLSIISLFSILILWLLTWVVNLTGVGPRIEMHTNYWKTLNYFTYVAEKHVPEALINIVRLFAMLLIPIVILYNMLAAYVAIYRWQLLLSLGVGFIGGGISLVVLNLSYLNAVFIKIKELDKAYSYNLLKKEGILTDNIGGLAITLTCDEKTGSMNVKDANGNDIPFGLALRRDLSPETEIYQRRS